MRIATMIFLPVGAAIFLAGAGAVSANEAAPEPQQLERWSFLITYGQESCPEAEDNEIVVCAERPESERYRIPEPVREKKTVSTGAQSLASATKTLDGLARQSRPNGCSVIGSNGFSGCQAEALRQWFAERNLNAETEEN